VYPQIDLARRVRVAQHMAAKVSRVQRGRLGMLDEDVADCGRGAQWTERHLHAHEHVPVWDVHRPSVAQVERQRLGHGRQQRQREGDSGLWPHDVERGGVPVDVLELQPMTSPAPKP